jgi:hypothetical protein
MALPADNGNPKKEKEDGEKRITNVANVGACVQKEVKLNQPESKYSCIFGDI